MSQLTSLKFRMKPKELEGHLQQVQGFERPKLHFEQFITTSHLASQILYEIDRVHGDLAEKTVCDLGVGTGMLAIGSAIMGADLVVGIDIDKDALSICQKNVDNLEIENIELINADCEQVLRDDCTNMLRMKFDTVIMNPPFGTKNNGIDVLFLRLALSLCDDDGAIYSLHKSNTREFLRKRSESWGLKMERICEMKYNIPKVDNRNKSLHKTAPEKDILVDLLRFTKC